MVSPDDGAPIVPTPSSLHTSKNQLLPFGSVCEVDRGYLPATGCCCRCPPLDIPVFSFHCMECFTVVVSAVAALACCCFFTAWTLSFPSRYCLWVCSTFSRVSVVPFHPPTCMPYETERDDGDEMCGVAWRRRGVGDVRWRWTCPRYAIQSAPDRVV